jgi:hypothetical protein
MSFHRPKAGEDVTDPHLAVAESRSMETTPPDQTFVPSEPYQNR